MKKTSGEYNFSYSCTSKNSKLNSGTIHVAAAAEFSQSRNPGSQNKTFANNTSASVVCKAKHPPGKCHFFQEMANTERTKAVAAQNFCLSCFRGQLSSDKALEPVNLAKKKI